MESTEWHNARAELIWQLELGADECIGEAPVDRFALQANAPKAAATAAPAVQTETVVVPKSDTGELARDAGSVEALRAAIAGFDGCGLKKIARNLVFSAGDPAARLMIVGGIPDRDEDRRGAPFAGANRVLFDAMFRAIGFGFEGADQPLYTTCAVPWRTPQGRAPSPEDRAMLRPFLLRHIELVAPDVVVAMGRAASDLLWGKPQIGSIRGTWQEVIGIPAMVMQHPRSILGRPDQKREAWADLLAIKAKLRAGA